MIFLTNTDYFRNYFNNEEVKSVVGSFEIIDNFDLIKEIIIAIMIGLLFIQNKCFETLILVH